MAVERLCSDPVEACVCALPTGHDGPHVCDCGGSWHWDGAQLEVDAFPGGAPASLAGMLETLDRMIGELP